MKPGAFIRTSAILLLCVTIAAIAVMWRSNFWTIAGPEVAAFGLAAAWLIFFAVGAERPRLKVILIPLLLAVAWHILQLALGATVYRWDTSVVLLYWAAGVSIVFVGLQIFADDSTRRWYLRALVIAGFAMAIIAPLQLYTSDAKIFWLFKVQYSNVAMGPFLYPNQYAAFIELLLPIALTFAFSDRTGWRTFHGLASVVMYASVLASASRTGFVLTSLEIVAVPLLAAKRLGIERRQLITTGAVFLTMLVVLGLAVGPQTLITKLQQKDPYSGRREFAESSLKMIHDRPWLGIGMGNWPVVYPAYATFDDGLFANQAHNDWAQWAVEGGVPFALFIFAVALWSFRQGLRTGWGLGISAVFLQCFVDYPIQRIAVALVLFSMIGATAYCDEPVVEKVRSRSKNRTHSRNNR